MTTTKPSGLRAAPCLILEGGPLDEAEPQKGVVALWVVEVQLVGLAVLALLCLHSSADIHFHAIAPTSEGSIFGHFYFQDLISAFLNAKLLNWCGVFGR